MSLAHKQDSSLGLPFFFFLPILPRPRPLVSGAHFFPFIFPTETPICKVFYLCSSWEIGFGKPSQEEAGNKRTRIWKQGTKSLEGLEVGGKKRASKSSSAKQGWLPWHSATVGAEGRARDVGLRDNGVLIHLWEPGSALD